MSDVLKILGKALEWCYDGVIDGEVNEFVFSEKFNDLYLNNKKEKKGKKEKDGKNIDNFYFIVKLLYYIAYSGKKIKNFKYVETNNKGEEKEKGASNREDISCFSTIVDLKGIKLWDNFATDIIGIYAKKVEKAEEFNPKELWKLSYDDNVKIKKIRTERKPSITDAQINNIVNEINNIVPALMTWFFGNLPKDIFQKSSNEEIKDILQQGHQIILQGPPGSGKTRMAKIVAAELIKDENETEDSVQLAEDIIDGNNSRYRNRIRFVQFHPSYAYEDFIMGIEISCQDSMLQYTGKCGVIKEFADEIIRDNIRDNHETMDGKPYVLIIDEINRAPLSTVMGELLYALENRGTTISIQSYDDENKELIIPNNLFIIGTMNTADRSIAGMDYAMRRRFAFVDVNSERIPGDDFDNKLYDKVSGLFDEKHIVKGIDGKDIMPGVSYFLTKKDNEFKKYKIKYEIVPLLIEYYKDGFFKKKSTIETSDGKSRILEEVFSSNDSLAEYLDSDVKGENN